MDIRQYQRFTQINGGIPCEIVPITLDKLYNISLVEQTPNGSGFFSLDKDQSYILKMTGIGVDSINAPVIDSISPTWNNGILRPASPPYVVVGASPVNNMIFLRHSTVGTFTYTFNVSWTDDNGCPQTGSFEFKIIVT